MGEDMIRWARADAVVIVPRLERRPVALRLKIARAVDPAARLRVMANDCTVYEGVVPHGSGRRNPRWRTPQYCAAAPEMRLRSSGRDESSSTRFDTRH
jgi:hypothetical protein